MSDPNIQQVMPAPPGPTEITIGEAVLARELHLAEQRAAAGWRERALIYAQMLQDAQAELTGMKAQIEEMKATVEQAVEDAIAKRVADQPAEPATKTKAH